VRKTSSAPKRVHIRTHYGHANIDRVVIQSNGMCVDGEWRSNPQCTGWVQELATRGGQDST
jgi:hypothetical protein